MPKGYVILTVNINDQDAFQGYVEKATGTIMAQGGSAAVVDDAVEVIEGEWPWGRTVVLEFESVDKAREWYNSPEYQAVVGERHAAADANAVIVSGFQMPS
jgi:uncharacterized protein (DUF1330 family)